MTKFICTIAGANFAAAGLGQATPIWTPAALGTDLLAFFDADDTTSMELNGNNELISIQPSQGTSFTLVNQYSAAAKAKLLPAAWNGGPCIEFTPGSGGVTGSVLIGEGPTNETGCSVFVVAERGEQLDLTGTSIRPMVRLPGPRVNGLWQSAHVGFWRPTLDTTQTAMTAGQHQGTRAANAEVSGWGIGQRHIGYAAFSAAQIAARIDGGAPATGGSWYDVASTKWSLGGMDNANNTQTGYRLKAFLAMRGVPSDGLRQKIEGYLAWTTGLRTNLAGDHPYYNDGPYV